MNQDGGAPQHCEYHAGETPTVNLHDAPLALECLTRLDRGVLPPLQKSAGCRRPVHMRDLPQRNRHKQLKPE